MFNEDDFLRKLYKLLAVLWMVAVILMSIAVGLSEKNIKAAYEFFLFMLYPYFAVWVIYTIISQKYRGLENTKGKWVGQSFFKSVCSITSERILIFFISISSAVFYVIAVLFVLGLIDVISEKL